MRQRCFNPNDKGFSLYGGLGVKVCDRWRTDFLAFLRDMGPKPIPGWHIHRKNSDDDYKPDNCIWIEPKTHHKIPRRPTIKGLTKRQTEVLDFIIAQDLTPSIRDIGDHFGITPKGAYDHIKALQRKGKITMQPNKARSIAIVPDS